MNGVEIRNQDRDGHDNQEDVSKDEIRTPEGHLNDLDDELASWLGHGCTTKASSGPFTSPPCSVGFIVLELSSEEGGNDDLVNCALNGNDTDDTEDSV